MAYDEGLAERVRDHFRAQDPPAPVVEKKMFGGLAFIVGGHMCVGVNADTLMVRVGPERYEDFLAEPHARQMDFTGRPLRGYLYVEPEGYAADEDLANWVRRCERFVTTLPPK
ncbi:MAG: TfoX/Sxy family protein [Acidobacteriota bacterium]